MGTLRTTLALSVVIWHCGGMYGWFPFNGTACVTLFFIISGFYMALILNRKYVGSGSTFVFWSNRFLRLWPCFVVSILITIPLRPGVPAEAVQTITDVSSLIFVAFSNVTMVAYESQNLLCLNEADALTPCSRAAARSINDLFYLPQGWSIGLELWFYLLAPFLLRSSKCVLGALIVSMIFFVAARRIGWGDVWIYRFFPSVAFFFFLGAASFFWGERIAMSKFEPFFSATGKYALALTLFLLVFPQSIESLLPPDHHNKLFVLMLVVFLPTWFWWSKTSVWDTAIGNLSYTIYVVHVALISWVDKIMTGIFVVPVVLLTTIAAAAIMYHYIEEPVDRWRQRMLAQSRRSYHGVSSAL
jgi:peptidoglycan/LPS O-acetylase OafA/YrhL